MVYGRLLFAPIAAAVFKQEQMEGDLRSAHARLRACAIEASLSQGAVAEQVRVTCHWAGQDPCLTSAECSGRPCHLSCLNPPYNGCQ